MSVHSVLRRAKNVVTTSAVLIEICDALSAPNWRETARKSIESMLRDPKVSVINVDANLLQSAVNLFAQRPDKHWSLTDCISFVVMNDMKMTQALTADRHFEQAGFVALMRR